MAVPKRELFKAPEVCEMAQLQPYVLRSWEAEFPALGQTAATGGPRLYRRADVELVLRIKQLVFGEGLTLAGARRRLDEEREEAESTPVLTVDDALGEMARARLREVRSGLEAILAMLDRPAPPELMLVPPVARSNGNGAAPAGRDSKARTAAKRRASA